MNQLINQLNTVIIEINRPNEILLRTDTNKVDFHIIAAVSMVLYKLKKSMFIPSFILKYPLKDGKLVCLIVAS